MFVDYDRAAVKAGLTGPLSRQFPLKIPNGALLAKPFVVIGVIIDLIRLAIITQLLFCISLPGEIRQPDAIVAIGVCNAHQVVVID